VRALNEYGVRTVFHLAAETIVGEAGRSPLATFETNVRGTYNLLEAARITATGTPARVVVASSYHAYGRQDTLPFSEDLPLRPRNPYEVSKACADMIARCYAATFDMPVAVTRLANVYGEGDLNFSRLVPDTARALARREAPVIRSDGTPERDYLYVGDAVDAYLAIERSLDRPELWGRAWNAGSGEALPVAELVRCMIAASGQELEPEIQGTPEPGAGVDSQYLDTSAIAGELAWEPSIGLERGLDATWAWYARNLA
jgi:CDP-glucose 4,6-dehydratase